jgi:indolepyruvate ferredoxin oxidoreductase
MLGFPPYSELMQNYVGMGLGGGAGAGMGPFVENPHMVFMGDSTFFHSGLVAISDSIKNNLDITYVILENKTTAMTGHQPTAENAQDIMGRPTRTQDIERILRGMVPDGLMLRRIDPGRREEYERLMAECLRTPGVKVIISDKECAITAHRRESAERKRLVAERGFLEREVRIGIDEEVCDNCLECVDQTACPGLAVVETALGPKIATDLTTCVDDGACSRTRACPSFARLTIRRKAPAGSGAAITGGAGAGTLTGAGTVTGSGTVTGASGAGAGTETGASGAGAGAETGASGRAGSAAAGGGSASAGLPELPPPPAAPAIEPGTTWSAYLGGVGGMGIGVLTGIVARAGEFDGCHAHFVTRNGLAIRNGGVYGHLVLSRGTPPDSPFEFYGDADLLLGIDLLEACRGVHPGGNLRVAHRGRTRAVVNLGAQQTVLSQASRDTLDSGRLAALLRTRTRDDASLHADFSRIAEIELGSRVFVNVMLLGVAYQRGWLPLSEAALLRAIESGVRAADRAANLRAFRRGRELALELAADAADAATIGATGAAAGTAGAATTGAAAKGGAREGERAGEFAAVVAARAAVIERERGGGTALAAAYRGIAERAGAELPLPEADRRYAAHALGDLVRYGGVALAEQYLAHLRGVMARDGVERGFRATSAALRAFFRLMTPKDEFWVARLLTSPAKLERDRRRYGIDPARGDSLEYAFLVRPRLTLFGREREIPVAAPPWILRLVASCSFLRTWGRGWNREDDEFLAWFLAAVDEAGRSGDYERLAATLERGGEVAGFRAVRRRQREAARRAIEALRAEPVRRPAEGQVAAAS